MCGVWQEIVVLPSSFDRTRAAVVARCDQTPTRHVGVGDTVAMRRRSNADENQRGDYSIRRFQVDRRALRQCFLHERHRQARGGTELKSGTSTGGGLPQRGVKVP
jgi:hypothetical protein